MGESAPQSFKSPEQHNELPLTPENSHERQLTLPDHEHAQPVSTERNPLDRIAEARNEASVNAQETNPLEKFTQQVAADTAPVVPKTIDKELKGITLKRELKHIQRRESAPARALSKVIHQPAVRITSEAAGRTVSRPSGLLGGGILAFVGTSAYLYMARHYGFEYNYMIFLALFVGGFAIGLIVELALWMTLSARRRTQN